MIAGVAASAVALELASTLVRSEKEVVREEEVVAVTTKSMMLFACTAFMQAAMLSRKVALYRVLLVLYVARSMPLMT